MFWKNLRIWQARERGFSASAYTGRAGLPLRLEQLEDRENPAPVAALSGLPALGATQPLLGSDASFGFDFTNSAPVGVGNTGYAPFIEVAVDTTGEDGAGVAIDDGLGTPTVTASGIPLSPVGSVVVSGATFVNPFTNQTRAVPAGFGVGDTIYVYALPFGSFTPGQTTAVNVTVPTSNLADLNQPLELSVTGGFRDDEPSLNGPGIYGSTVATDITPQLYRLTKTYLGPESETATGPNYVRRYRIDVDVATGQAVTNVRITDDLAASMQMVGRNSTNMFASTAAGGLGANSFVVGNSSGSAVTTAPDGTITYNFGGLTGVAGVDARFEFDFFVPRDTSAATAIVPQGTDSTNGVNTTSGLLDWNTLDARDPDQTNLPPATSGSVLSHTLEQHSVAVQKSMQLIDPATGAALSGNIRPGNTLLQVTLDFQVSDYFAVQNVLLNDTVGDGLRLFTGTRGAVTAGVPTLSVNNAFLANSGTGVGSRTTSAAAAFDGGTIDYERRYSLASTLPPGALSDPTSFAATGPTASAFSAPTVGGTIDGSTLLTFNISDELIRRLGANAGRLVGGEIGNNGSGPANANPSPLGAATGRIVYYLEIVEDFSDTFPSNDRSVDQGDQLNNTVDDLQTAGRDGIVAEQISATTINAATPTAIGTATDDSAASVTLSYGAQSKQLVAINGQGVPGQTFTSPPYSVQAGDRVTYLLTYSLPTSSFENLTLTDLPPLPVMDVDVPTFSFVRNPAAYTFAAGQIGVFVNGTTPGGLTDPNFISDTYFNTFAPGNGAGRNPTITVDSQRNSLALGFGTHDDQGPGGQRFTTISVLLTLPVSNDPFAADLFLTNQLRIGEGSTNAGDITVEAIQRFELVRPNVTIDKGVVGANSTGFTLGGIAFTNPTLAANFSGGPIDTAAEADAIGARNLGVADAVDAGDRVRFAIVAQNIDKGDAFDIRIRDVLPIEYDRATFNPATDLRVFRGDGTLLSSNPLAANYGYDVVSYNSATGEFILELVDNYSAGNIGGATEDNRLGALSRGFRTDQSTPVPQAITNGSNTIVVLYDVTLQNTVTPNQLITNTATVTTYATNEGGPDLTNQDFNGDGTIDTTDPTDTANVRIKLPITAKVLTGTEVNAPGNNATGGSGAQATIGEFITYTVTIAVPEGSTPGAVIRDTLQAGLAFVDVQSVTFSSGLSASTPPDLTDPANPTNTTIAAGGGTIAFNLGTLTNSNTNNATPETITIVYRAVVLNTAANQTNQTRNNSAEFDWTGNTTTTAAVASGQTTNTSGAATGTATPVTIVEPAIITTKDIRNISEGETFPVAPGTPQTTRADAGDTLQYRITIRNPTLSGTNTTTAFDVTLSDPLPITFFSGGASAFSIASVSVSGLGEVRRNGLPRTLDASDFAIDGAGVLTLNAAFEYDIDPDVTIAILVTGTNFLGFTGGLVNNVADVRWTSLDGTPGTRSTHNTNSTERTGANGEGSGLNNFADADNAQIESPPVIRKTLVATSESHTSGTDVAVGEIVRYRLVASIPEGSSPNFQIADVLPAGMSFLNDNTARWAFVSTGGGAISSATVSTVPSLGSPVIGTGGIDGNNATISGIASASIIGTFADANIGTSANGAGTGEGSVYADGASVFFRFGSLTNADNDPGDVEYIVVEFNALVRNQTSNQGGTTLGNRMAILADIDGNGTAGYINAVNDTNGDGTGSGEPTIVANDPANDATGTAALSAPLDVTVREPNLQITKRAIATTGSVVTYRVTVTNPSATNATTAFDTRIIDILNSTNFTLLGPAGLTASLAGGAATATNNSSGNTVDFTIATIPVGGSVTIDYQATVLVIPTGATSLDNTVNATTTGLPGASGTGGSWTGVAGTSSTVPGGSGSATGERTGQDGMGGALNDYAVADTERLGSLGNRVYFDADADGVQDAGEPGLVGVPVTVRWAGLDGIFSNADDSVITVNTGANGAWTVNALPLGPTEFYRVSVPTTFSGMAVTDVRDNGGAANTNPDGLGVGVSAITLTGATAATTNNDLQDFGYRGTASLGNRVYVDADADGVQDANGLEPSLPGVTVALTWAGADGDFSLTADNLTFTTTTTNAAANYLFSFLPSGDFRVAVSPTGGVGGVPLNSTLTDVLDNGGAANTDPDGLGAGTTQTNLSLGESETTIDFGYQGNASLGNYVWYDVDGDGVQTANEPPIAGATVTAIWFGPNGTFGGGDDVTFTTATDANGLYTFPGIPANALSGANPNYRVSVAAPAAFPTLTDSLDNGALSATNPVDVQVSPVNGDALNDRTDVDFGFRGTASLGDLVWHDLNGNGRQDGGLEVGIDGVSVQLFFDRNNDGDFADAGENVALASTTTSGGGLYAFNNLAAGNYQVVFGNTSGATTYTRTVRDSAVAVDGTDSDGDVTTGRTATYTLSNGQSNQTVDQGLYIPVTLGNRIFFDHDGDGVQDSGESGIPGATVQVVWLGPDATFGTGDDQPFSTTTGVNGIWSISNLPPGSYRVTATPPTGQGWTLTDSIDNAALSATNPATISTTSGVDRDDVDFGFRSTASLGNRVFVDADADGLQDGNGLEPGIPGVTVTLRYDANGDGDYLDADDGLFTTITDATGAYSFTFLPPGDYQISVPATGGTGGLPLNMTLTDSLDNGVLNAAATTTTNLSLGESETTIDFGYQGNASLGDRVYLDQIRDGIQTADPGISNVGVLLTWFGADGVFGTTDDIVFTTTTGANGLYLFDGLPANALSGATPNYRVEITSLPIPGLVLSDSIDNGVLSPVNPVDVQVSPTDGDALNDRRDVDFGYDGARAISGNVYRDDDNDGLIDSGEPGIGGVALTLTGTDVFGNNWSFATTTAGDGSYTFATVVPGTYTITETQPAAYNDGIDTVGTPFGGNTIDDAFTGLNVPVGSGPDGVQYNFGERPTFVSGRVFRDSDRSGVQNGSEPGIAGVTVELYDSTGTTLLATTTTDVNGDYRFTNIPAADYQIRETQPAGYANTPTGPFASNTRNVTVPLAGLIEQNFGEVLGSISGVVYIDANNDGVRAPGDTGRIAGVAVTLTGTDVNNNAMSRTAFTDFSGAYRFDDLFASNASGYTVTEGSAAPFTDRAANPGTGAGGVNGSAVGANSLAGIVLTTGSQGVNFDFGEIRSPVTFLSGVVYRDDNLDGSRQTTEPGIAGVRIDLYDLSFTLLATTTTDANGFYSFTGLMPGGTYVVVETQPGGYGNAPENANNVIVANVPLTGSQNNNFGERVGSLTGTVYFDANLSNRREAGEAGLAGIIVTLSGTDVNGTPVSATTTTDAQGNYRFSNLLAGTYVVTQPTQPAGYASGAETVGSAGGIVTNATPPAEAIGAIPLGAGINATGYDFGEIGVPVSGRVFHDRDRNGTQNGTEPGISGVAIQLIDSTGTVIATTPTNAAGDYTFPSVAPGSYTIREVQPTGYGDTPVGAFRPNTRPITVAGVAIAGQDFGDILSTLAGSVYVDSGVGGGTANNGIRDGSEPGIGGVSVRLDYAGADGIFGNGDDVTGFRTTTTGATGGYRFTDLATGVYRVVEPTQPAPYSDGLEREGTAGGDISTNDTIATIPVGAGIDLTGYDFGELAPAQPFIAGSVYVDTDNDGTRDPGEPGIAGVTVTLTGPGGPFSTTTDANGNYLFAGLTAGANYVITETQPSAYGPGLENTGNVINVSNLPATGSFENNFGERPGFIAGTVYYDADSSGGLNGGDVRLPGVTVALLDGSGAAVNDPLTGQPHVVTTDANGDYRFDNLPAGNYRVIETQPTQYNQGTNTPGSGAVLGGLDRIDVALAAGGASTGNHFGELGADITGTVWLDTNKDGAIQPTETTRLGGVTLELRDATGRVLATTTTNPDGTYAFRNLPPGNYSIAETQPNGYGSSTTNLRPVTLTSAGVANQDFGETLGSLAGKVYADRTDNGVFESSIDYGLSGVSVRLTGTDINGVNVDVTVQTDANGDYRFTDLIAGVYTVTETQPTAYQDGKDRVGTAGGSAAVNDVFSAVSIGAGVDATGYEFAEVTSSLAGFVYRDYNLSGSRDTNAANPETGIGSITIALTGTDLDGRPVARTTATATDGSYSFVGLGAGNYTLTETQPPLPTSLLNGFYPGADSLGSLGGTNVSLLDDTLDVFLGRSQNGVNYDFGELPPADPFGYVYHDLNNNGIMEPGEPGLAGVPITIFGTAFAGTIFARPLAATDLPRQSFTAWTDGNGRWEFPILPPGNYSFVESVQPAGFDDGREQDADPNGPAATVGNDRFDNVILNPFPIRGPFNFGEVAVTGSLSGTVYVDTNNNGVRDPGEMGIPGVTMSLLGGDITGQNVSAIVVTDANGNFSFQRLRPGTYQLHEAHPWQFVDGRDTAGSHGGAVLPDAIYSIVLGPGQAGVNYQFGEVGLVPAMVTKRQFLGSSTPTDRMPMTPGSGVTVVNAVPPAAIRAPFALSPYQPFVRSLFRSVLGREGDAGGVAYYTSLLDSGTRREAVIRSFLDSLEYRINTVRSLYLRYFDRAADGIGLQHHLNLLASGMTVEQLSAGLLASDEYFVRHGGTAGFLAGVYQNLLGRAIDSVGQSAYTAWLQGGASRLDVVHSILASREAHMAYVRSVYPRYLGREADAVGRNLFVSLIERTGRHSEVLYAVLGSEEFDRR